MATPFRNDADALRTRLASLDEELAALRAKSAEYEAVKERLASLEEEHAAVRKEIDARSARRPAPFLDTLKIATPCDERWDDMIGDERTRFCPTCSKNVHNISEMARAEAEAFLDSVAGPVCIRMYKRIDGTVLTADCPVGVHKKRVKRLFLATIGGGVAAIAGALAYWRFVEVATMGEPQVGQMVATPPPEPTFATPPPEPTFATPPPKPTFATPPPKQTAPVPYPREEWCLGFCTPWIVTPAPPPAPTFATPPTGSGEHGTGGPGRPLPRPTTVAPHAKPLR